MPHHTVVDIFFYMRLILIVAQPTTTLLSNENNCHPQRKKVNRKIGTLRRSTDYDRAKG